VTPKFAKLIGLIAARGALLNNRIAGPIIIIMQNRHGHDGRGSSGSGGDSSGRHLTVVEAFHVNQ